MKFRCVDEFEQLSFDDSPIVSFQMSEDEVQAVMKEAINAVAVDRSEAAQKEDEALENQ